MTNTMPREASPMQGHSVDDDAALTRIVAAAAAEQAAKRAALANELEAAHNDLQDAVDAARMLGIGWTKIGDTLGIRSANGSQRYRRSPTAAPR